MSDLNDDFEAFKASGAGDKPVFEIARDWRARLKKAAIENGDMAADKKASNDFDSTYWDSSEESELNTPLLDENGNEPPSW